MTFLFVRGHVLAAQGVASSAIQRAASPRARVAGASDPAGLRRHDQRQSHRGPRDVSVRRSPSATAGGVLSVPRRRGGSTAGPASWADDNHTIYADMGQQGYPQGAIPEWPWAALTAPLSQTAM